MSPLRAACQDDEDRSMQSLDDSIPSLVASSSESETDSDEEDYRQLEAQEEAKESGIGQSLLRSLRTTPRGESSGGAGLRRTKPKK